MSRKGVSMKIRSMCCWLVALVVFALPAAGQTNPASQLIAIKAGKVGDPETGKTAAHQVILLEGKKIKEIGSNVTIPADAKIIDLSQATVLPGPFHAHTPLCPTVIPHRRHRHY